MSRTLALLVAAILPICVGLLLPAIADRVRYGIQQRPGRSSRDAWELRRIIAAACIPQPKYPGGDWVRGAADDIIGRLERYDRARVLVDLALRAGDSEVHAHTYAELTELFALGNGEGPDPAAKGSGPVNGGSGRASGGPVPGTR